MGHALRPVTPLSRTTLSAAAFEQLISYVVNGHWKAGDRIPPERDLCQQLGIARTSLREALKGMELVGMLDSRIGDGTFVCPRSEFLSRPLLWAFTGTDQNELRDIMETRTVIEADLACLAAERGSDEDIAKIGQAVQSMSYSIARGDSILEADLSFHSAISAAARNEVMGNAAQLLRNLMRQWIYIPDAVPNVLKSHIAIYRAISRRRPTTARREMRRHLEESMRLITQVVEQGGVQVETRSGQRSMNSRAPKPPIVFRKSPRHRGARRSIK